MTPTRYGQETRAARRTRAVLAACAAGVMALTTGASIARAQTSGARVEISFPAAARTQPVTGRVYLFVAQDSTREPRFQGGGLGQNAPFFGADVNQLHAGQATVIDASTPGFPVRSLDELPDGAYYIQALLNVYTRFHRADGHVIWAHMDQWEGQQPASSPGNLVSRVQKVHLGPGRASARTIHLTLTDVIPPVHVPVDTKWIRHVKIQSKLLTAFWGHPMYLGAVVLLPRDYDAHPDLSYPVDYEQDHFSLAPPYHFQEEPVYPVDSLKVGHRAWVINMRRGEGYQLYRDWTSADFPRMLMVTFLHPTRTTTTRTR